MNIQLGDYVFDAATTTATGRHEETGGRDARNIQISGLIATRGTLEEVEADLDAILEAASASEAVALTLRPGRVLHVRRTAFKRVIAQDPLVGSFQLSLEAVDPFERSIVETEFPWEILESGSVLELSTQGNACALPILTLTASGVLTAPCIDDGERSLCYPGVLTPGQVLVFDAVNNRATLDAEDVTPYTTGAFPRIPPGGALFTYTDDLLSDHTADAVIRFHDRWW